MRKLKIALIAYEFYPNPGGIAYTLTSLWKSFHKKEHLLYVFNQNYNGKNAFDVLEKKDLHFKEIILFFKKRKLIYFLLLSIWKIIKDKKITFSDRLMILLYLFLKPKILINTIKNISNLYPFFKKLNFNLIFGGSLGSRTITLSFVLSRIFNVKVITFAHGNEILVHSPFSLRTYYIRNLDNIIIHTEKLKKILLKIHHLNENKINLLPTGLHLEKYLIDKSKKELREEYNIPKNDFILLSVGRHISRKNFDLVIKGLNEIKKKVPNTHFKYYLIGEGSDTEKLKNLAIQLNLEKEVIFLGLCDDSKRNKFYKLSDLFIMPSISEKESIEGFGVVYIEANYYKLPVIGTFSGGITEVIKDGKTGLLIKPGDLNDLIEKVLYLYNNKDIRYKMGEQGFKRVIEEFNWDKLYYDYSNVFKKIINDS